MGREHTQNYKLQHCGKRWSAYFTPKYRSDLWGPLSTETCPVPGRGERRSPLPAWAWSPALSLFPAWACSLSRLLGAVP